MPLPKTKDMGKMMEFLKKEKTIRGHMMSKKQMIAIALKQTGKSEKK